LMVTHNMEVANQIDRVDNLAHLNRAVAAAKQEVAS